MIPFKQKPNSICNNTAVLIILLCISDCCFSYLQEFRRTTDNSRRYGNIDHRLATTKGDSSLPSPALQREPDVSPYIRDVRADSRQSRIDARDIRTDFREIRTELRGDRRENSCVRESRTTSHPITSDKRRAMCQDINNNVRYDEYVRNDARNRRDTRKNRADSRLTQNYSLENIQRQLNRKTRDSSDERKGVEGRNGNLLREANNRQGNDRRQLFREERLEPSTQHAVRRRTTARYADRRLATRSNRADSRLNQNYSLENIQRQLNRETRDSSEERLGVEGRNGNLHRESNNRQENVRRQLFREERLEPSTQHSVRGRTTARYAVHRSTPSLETARGSSRRFREIKEHSDTSRMATNYNSQRRDRKSQEPQKNREDSHDFREGRERYADRTALSRDRREVREDSRRFRQVRDRSDGIIASRNVQRQYERREQQNSRDSRINGNSHTDRSTSRNDDRKDQRRTGDQLNNLQERQNIARVTRNSRFARHNLERRSPEATQEWARTLRQSGELTNSRHLVEDRRKRQAAFKIHPETQRDQSRRVRNIRESSSTNDNNRQLRFVLNERRENIPEQPKDRRAHSRQMREDSASENNRLDRQSLKRNTNQNRREYSRQMRESREDSIRSVEHPHIHQERRDTSREQLENRRERSLSNQDRRVDVIRQKTPSSFDRRNENPRTRLADEFRENSRKNRQQAFENVRENHQDKLEREDTRNMQRNLMRHDAFERRHILNSDRRDTVRDENQERNIRAFGVRTDDVRDSSTRDVKLEALRDVEFIPNFTEKSNILTNTLQAVLIVAIFGQIFWSTSKNKFRFSHWQSIFGKEKLY